MIDPVTTSLFVLTSKAVQFPTYMYLIGIIIIVLLFGLLTIED